jgi:hypothetical protein
MPAKKGRKLSSTTPRAIAVERKRRDAIELRSQCWSYAAIAETLKVSKARAHQLVSEAIKESIQDPIDRHVHLAIYRAEVAMTQTFPRVAAGDQLAISNWLAIENRIDKLRGIVSPDAAAGQNLNVSGGLKHEIVVSFVKPELRPDPMLIDATPVNGHTNGKGNGHG